MDFKCDELILGKKDADLGALTPQACAHAGRTSRKRQPKLPYENNLSDLIRW